MPWRTWRSLARLHMWQTGFRLHVMHGYAIPFDEALEFARLVHRVDVDTLSNIDVVNNARRPLLPYAALVPRTCPAHRPAAAGGVLRARRRERAALFAAQRKEQEKDALDRAARHLNQLRFAFAMPCEELIDWTDRLIASSGLQGDRRGTASAPRCVPARRYRLACASGLSRVNSRSTSSPTAASAASTILAVPIWRRLSSFAMSA